MEVIIFKSYAIIGLVIFIIYPYIDEKFKIGEDFGVSSDYYHNRLFISFFYPLVLFAAISSGMFGILYNKVGEERFDKAFRVLLRFAEFALAIYLIYCIID